MKKRINRVRASLLIVMALTVFPVFAALLFPRTGLAGFGDIVLHKGVGPFSILCGAYFLVWPVRAKQYLKSQEQTERGRDGYDQMRPLVFRLMGASWILFGAFLLWPSVFLAPLLGIKP